MNREIIFRAKLKQPGGALGDWVEGGFFKEIDGSAYIYDNKKTFFNRVKPDTVCQYTGLKDKNGIKIFEGDILEGRLDDDCPDYITMAVVEWLGFGWAIRQLDCDCDPDPMDETDIGIWTVIGNVFDSPEMLEVERIGGEK